MYVFSNLQQWCSLVPGGFIVGLHLYRNYEESQIKSTCQTHNPLLECNQLLLLLLPTLKVSINQALQLHQILVLTFLLDVLHNQKRPQYRMGNTK